MLLGRENLPRWVSLAQAHGLGGDGLGVGHGVRAIEDKVEAPVVALEGELGL